mmetsp:Transcript_38304/g.81785  ORF Transcript_38304/g.81785 Transcript_38304/m.81785 type:complete len:125 (+) Transcript_38304:1395-1769(+)
MRVAPGLTFVVITSDHVSHTSLLSSGPLSQHQKEKGRAVAWTRCSPPFFVSPNSDRHKTVSNDCRYSTHDSRMKAGRATPPTRSSMRKSIGGRSCHGGIPADADDVHDANEAGVELPQERWKVN